ncbi:MAG: SDR family oxidoreductase, partial [Chloroflexota bacterium]|nr:SDR family oxidoreductase [Chloroflexota bacterium]
MYSIDLSGKNGVIVGVANDRSIAWGIASILAEAGARLALTYQNDRVKYRVTKLADTLDGAITMPCDATVDAQVQDVFKQVGDNFGEISFLVHSIAFANKADLTGSFSDTSREGFRIALEVSAFTLLPLVHHAAK